MFKSPSATVLKISKLISDVFNPMNSLLFFYLLYSIKNYSWKEALDNFLPVIIIMIIPILLWIIYHVKTNRYSDMDVSDRKQRQSLYFFIAGCMVLYLLYGYVVRQKTDAPVLFLLFLLFAMQISNYFIKSSMHTALNIFVAALLFTISHLYGFIWVIIAVIVGVSRIILKRHSPAEVLSGAAIGSLVSFIYLYAHIQNI